MEVLWYHRECWVCEVVKDPGRGVVYTTVMTTMERLQEGPALAADARPRLFLSAASELPAMERAGGS